MKKTPELVIITKTYDLILWSCQHTSRFPRQHRSVFGERLKRPAIVIARLISALPRPWSDEKSTKSIDPSELQGLRSQLAISENKMTNNVKSNDSFRHNHTPHFNCAGRAMQAFERGAGDIEQSVQPVSRSMRAVTPDLP